MKKWVTITLIVIGLAGVIYLVQSGTLNWQTISIIAAAIAAPFKFIAGLFSSKDEEQEIIDRHQQIRAQEAEYRAGVATQIQEKEQNIVRLNQEVELIDQKLDELRRKRENVSKEVDAMNLSELQRAGQRLLGD
jgi:hypothetical protein